MLPAEPVADDPLIGRVIAERYRILRAIGEGGMGRVYLAEQRMGTATRAVALKVLSKAPSDRPSVARFYRECETVVSLSHPNTIRFYDFGSLDLPSANGTRDERLYIAMEYVEGRSLAEAIADGPIALETALRWVRQIGGALAEAHGRGIVHRDLKPDNVLLARNDVEGEIPKVCDFGIAKKLAAGEQAEITAQGTILGTPAYMSPEQISGMPVDERSDVYALGLIVYEMLTGSRPFDAQTPLEWASAHLTEPPRPFDDFAATRELSAERRAAILRALAKDPAARTPSIRAFVEEFTGASMGSTSEPPMRPPRLADPRAATATTTPATARGRPGRSAGAAVAVAAPAIALLAALGLAVTIGPSAVEPERRSVVAADDAGAAERFDGGDPSAPREWLAILHYEDRTEDAVLALGPPDGRCARILPRGTITLELTPGVRIRTDGTEAPDLHVVVAAEGSGPYRVDVGVERRQFTTVAQGLIATSPLDVDQYDLRRFRYVRIKNREREGIVCVDAVGAHRHD